MPSTDNKLLPTWVSMKVRDFNLHATPVLHLHPRGVGDEVQIMIIFWASCFDCVHQNNER